MKIEAHSVEGAKDCCSDVVTVAYFLHYLVQIRLREVLLGNDASCFKCLLKTILLLKLMKTYPLEALEPASVTGFSGILVMILF